MSPKFQISRDSQALYFTVVAKDRLPVFQTDAIKLVSCQALEEARKSGGKAANLPAHESHVIYQSLSATLISINSCVA